MGQQGKPRAHGCHCRQGFRPPQHIARPESRIKTCSLHRCRRPGIPHKTLQRDIDVSTAVAVVKLLRPSSPPVEHMELGNPFAACVTLPHFRADVRCRHSGRPCRPAGAPRRATEHYTPPSVQASCCV